MNKQETLARIAEVEAQIKELGKEREALRIEAVKNGWARWTISIRMTAPNLAWWKENKPRTWEKYTTPHKVQRFEVVAD